MWFGRQRQGDFNPKHQLCSGWPSDADEDVLLVFVESKPKISTDRFLSVWKSIFQVTFIFRFQIWYVCATFFIRRKQVRSLFCGNLFVVTKGKGAGKWEIDFVLIFDENGARNKFGSMKNPWLKWAFDQCSCCCKIRWNNTRIVHFERLQVGKTITTKTYFGKSTRCHLSSQQRKTACCKTVCAAS